MYLNTIVENKKAEMSEASVNGLMNQVFAKIHKARPTRDFKKALCAERISLIAEIKFRSPSKGILQEKFSGADLAHKYVMAGASAISVIADTKYFGGSSQLVHAIAHDPQVTIPVLYKDFIINPFQIYQARSCGADAVLLIARILSPRQLGEFVALIRALGMTPMVETFTEEDIKNALAAQADVIGINNRNLQSFQVDLAAAAHLRKLIPPGVIVVSESGITSREEVLALESQGFTGMLVGESILTAADPSDKISELLSDTVTPRLSSNGYFGRFGGRYTAETLVSALDEVESAFQDAIKDPTFLETYEKGCRYFIGRSTPTTPLDRLSSVLGGARIYAKREDLAHTGAHKINNAYGQAILAKKLGKTRIVAETGAGQHGVAVATVCARLGLECVVYMGADDVARQNMNVMRMRLLGAQVCEVTNGTRTLKDAVNESIRDWISNIHNTYYLLGSAVGPHPYPQMVHHFQSIIGREARQQMLELTGRLPDCVVACVGGGSNSIGVFSGFLDNPNVSLVGVQAAGQGLSTGKHSAPLVAGEEGIFQGARSFLMQDQNGQVLDTHSIAAGLDYASAGPEHAYLKETGRVTYDAVTDVEALEGFKMLCTYEGIIPALESCHAIARACDLAPKYKSSDIILVNISGRGDKDLHTVQQLMKGKGTL